METKEQIFKMLEGRIDTITQLSTECLEFMYLTGCNDGIEAAAKLVEQSGHPYYGEDIRKLKK